MEKKMLMTVHRAFTETQHLGSPEEHLVATVMFSLSIDDKVISDSVRVQQVLGSDYEQVGLEIGKLESYKGPLNYESFREAIEDYYRSCIGEQASAFRIEPGAKVNLINVTVETEKEYALPYPGREAGW